MIIMLLETVIIRLGTAIYNYGQKLRVTRLSNSLTKTVNANASVGRSR